MRQGCFFFLCATSYVCERLLHMSRPIWLTGSKYLDYEGSMVGGTSRPLSSVPPKVFFHVLPVLWPILPGESPNDEGRVPSKVLGDGSRRRFSIT